METNVTNLEASNQLLGLMLDQVYDKFSARCNVLKAGESLDNFEGHLKETIKANMFFLTIATGFTPVFHGDENEITQFMQKKYWELTLKI